MDDGVIIDKQPGAMNQNYVNPPPPPPDDQNCCASCFKDSCECCGIGICATIIGCCACEEICERCCCCC
ncbi:unnamed protein product [Bursaphelenchus okinawaensis]|uniref:Uncharacterized protein n=1 Tax=Bursaphelenchus okinawaensis TaxID=465554 RepID=A0A811L0Z9_9BILA|nr:unnamed protein product [Bursaphelenchus okinawaensis]CAG9114160.1 unnamed protein product [Bursaphelenchus okinawaensis]